MNEEKILIRPCGGNGSPCSKAEIERVMARIRAITLLPSPTGAHLVFERGTASIRKSTIENLK